MGANRRGAQVLTSRFRECLRLISRRDDLQRTTNGSLLDEQAARGFAREAAFAAASRLRQSLILEAGFDLLELLVHFGLKFLGLRNLEVTGIQDVQRIAAETEVFQLGVVELVKGFLV